MYRRDGHRLRFLIFVFSFFFLILPLRLLYIQVFKNRFFRGLAHKQYYHYIQIPPERGTIYDRHYKSFTINTPTYSIYASKVKDDTRISSLCKLLNIRLSSLKQRLKTGSFIWLKRRISSELAKKVMALNIEGIGLIKEKKRSYPHGELACHILGFTNVDNQGLEGIELYYEPYLRGRAGWAKVLRDAHQKNLLIGEKFFPEQDGFDVVLSIDMVIQYIVEQALEKAVSKWKPISATAIVMDPWTGQILALANRPNFDPNRFEDYPRQYYRNRAITDLFEPGSVFKVVTASAALEEGLFKEEDEIFCENGSYRIGSHILHDHKPHGWLSFSEVIEQSSNIGVTKIAQKLGEKRLFSYIKRFGFGSKTKIDFPGESKGLLRGLSDWSNISISSLSIGQEIAVNALQLVSCISTIANGGLLLRPYLVLRIEDKDRVIVKEFNPKIIRRAISSQTALRMKEILKKVVEKGTGRKAKIKGIKVAGKTGTAQKIENNRYSHKKFVASFIGFAPADKPLISVVVVLNEPKPFYYGGVVAAPIFKEIVEATLRYLESHPLDNHINYNLTYLKR